MPPWTPPEDFRSACHVSSKEQYDEMYKRSIEHPEGFWGDIANQFHWEKKVGSAVPAICADHGGRCHSACDTPVTPLRCRSCPESVLLGEEGALLCWRSVLTMEAKA